MKKILIIEDNKRHLQDAKNFFSTIEGIDVTYRESYFPREFSHDSPDFRKYDGIISDIYFPEFPGKKVDPIGVSIMFQCKMLNIPCVLCTSGHHHNSISRWVFNMYYGLRYHWKDIPRIIGSENEPPEEGGEDMESSHDSAKGWERAWVELQKYL